MVWIEVNTDSRTIPFKFYVEGTGHEIEPNTDHVGSWVQSPICLASIRKVLIWD